MQIAEEELHTRPGSRHVYEVVPDVVTFAQQVWPACFPHRLQREDRHRVPAAVHWAVPDDDVVVQQGIPGPPQLPHAPSWHVPGRGEQDTPLAMHMPDAQQPPPKQALPEQHTCPTSPQDWPLPPLPPPPERPPPPGAPAGAPPLFDPPEPMVVARALPREPPAPPA